MAELQPAVLFRYEDWIHAVSQPEVANEERIDVNVSFNGYRYWTLIFSQRASKGIGRYQAGFVIGMSGGNNDTQNWIAQLEDKDYKLIRRNNFTSVDPSVGDVYWNWNGNNTCYFSTRHGFEDLVTFKFVCDTQQKKMYCYMNQVYMGYGPLQFPTNQFSNGKLEVLKTWAQLGGSDCVSYIGDVWLFGAQTLDDATNYNGGEPERVSKGKFLVHSSSHPSGRKMASDSAHHMYGWKIFRSYVPPVPPDPQQFVPDPYTLYLRYRVNETDGPYFPKGIATKISESRNIWKLTYVNSDWDNLLMNSPGEAGYKLQELIAVNMTGVTSIVDFLYSSNITYLPTLDTSTVTNMNGAFERCQNLKHIPLLDTSSVTNMNYAFRNCTYVESGALALYQQASTQAVPPASHTGTFRDCGKYTVSGKAELDQIPTSWGGNLA